MDGRHGPRASSPLIGVAGRCTNEEEKAYVKQAVFLLRYRIRCQLPEAPPGPAAEPADP